MFTGILLDWTLKKYKETKTVKFLEKHVNIPLVQRAITTLGTLNMAGLIYYKRTTIYDFTCSTVKSIKQMF